MIKVYQYPAPKCFPNFSPFCVKLETYLKMAEIPYKNEYTFNLAKNPKKLMPYIECDGQIKGDSALIIDWLVSKYGDKVDYWLNDEQKAISEAFISMIEDNIAIYSLYFRWVNAKGWSQFRDLLFAKVPGLIKLIVSRKIAKKMRVRLYLHGTSRFTDDEKIQLLRKNLVALSTYLGNKQFFFGDKPALLDICMFSLFGNIIKAPVDMPLKQLAQEPCFANLREHTERMLNKFYPEQF